MEWHPIETAPKDGTAFLACNHDGEIWLARYENHGRLCFRTNRLYETTVHVEAELSDGSRGWVRDDARGNERWCSSWTLWARGYDFRPKLWATFAHPSAVPAPIEALQAAAREAEE